MRLIENPSLLTRLFVGKLTGIVIGLVAYVVTPIIYPEAAWTLRVGLLFWYVTVGAMIGIMGVMDRHPLWNEWRFPWWFLGPFLGAWMNFLLVLFVHDDIQSMVTWFLGANASAYFWFTLDGAITGAIIAFLATKFGGEGAATVLGKANQ